MIFKLLISSTICLFLLFSPSLQTAPEPVSPTLKITELKNWFTWANDSPEQVTQQSIESLKTSLNNIHGAAVSPQDQKECEKLVGQLAGKQAKLINYGLPIFENISSQRGKISIFKSEEVFDKIDMIIDAIKDAQEAAKQEAAQKIKVEKKPPVKTPTPAPGTLPVQSGKTLPPLPAPIGKTPSTPAPVITPPQTITTPVPTKPTLPKLPTTPAVKPPVQLTPPTQTTPPPTPAAKPLPPLQKPITPPATKGAQPPASITPLTPPKK